jgi:hypothetical protein
LGIKGKKDELDRIVSEKMAGYIQVLSSARDRDKGSTLLILAAMHVMLTKVSGGAGREGSGPFHQPTKNLEKRFFSPFWTSLSSGCVTVIRAVSTCLSFFANAKLYAPEAICTDRG